MPGSNQRPIETVVMDDKNGNRRLTSKDVARVAGVSESAVSRAFTVGASLAPAKRAHILKAARELGYRPNIMARAVVTRRSNVVGLILFNETNRHYPDVLLALSRAFSTIGVRVMLFLVDEVDEISSVIDHILSYQLDGVIAASPIAPIDLEHLAAAKVPLLFYNRPGEDGIASVSCDHYTSGTLIARHVISEGARRIALIRSYAGAYVGNERMRGVEEELILNGASIIADYRGDFNYDRGVAAVLDWDARDIKNYDAVIAANDMMAIGAKDALVFKLGKRVPQDIIVAGFDGIEASRWLSHHIASVDQPIEHMAKAAVEMMALRIENEHLPAERRLFPGRLQRGLSINQ
jgi:DNA-binding LacI/PurR family transcriptional regulator